MADQQSPENSPFRSWFRNCLGSLPGKTVEWPFLIRQILAEELQSLRTSDQYYGGAVFRNRDDRVHVHRMRDSDHEEILVYKLYSAVHENFHGILTIDNTPVWLFSLQVPNQGKRLSSQTKGRRADLLGLRPDGSLVLFEVKGPRNRQDSPLYGILEGLDYLGCLLTPRNLNRLNEGLEDWIVDEDRKDRVASRFSSSIPDWSRSIDPHGKHSVIVLAPESYFDLHLTDSIGRPQDWWLLSDQLSKDVEHAPRISLGFSVVDFEKGTASWFVPPSIPTETRLLASNVDYPELGASLPHKLIWSNGDTVEPVTKVRYGRKHTRILRSSGEKLLVPTGQLCPDEQGTPIS